MANYEIAELKSYLRESEDATKNEKGEYVIGSGWKENMRSSFETF
jgi:predicted amidohydrolase YtcJ